MTHLVAMVVAKWWKMRYTSFIVFTCSMKLATCPLRIFTTPVVSFHRLGLPACTMQAPKHQSNFSIQEQWPGSCRYKHHAGCHCIGLLAYDIYLKHDCLSNHVPSKQQSCLQHGLLLLFGTAASAVLRITSCMLPGCHQDLPKNAKTQWAGLLLSVECMHL